MYSLLKKTRNKILRKLDTIPFIQYQEDLAYQAAVKNHIRHLPILDKADLELVEQIKEEGVVITSLEKLGIPSTPDILAAAEKLIPKIPANISAQKHEFVIHATSQQIMEYPELFFWGLEQRLLNIVGNFLLGHKTPPLAPPRKRGYGVHTSREIFFWVIRPHP